MPDEDKLQTPSRRGVLATASLVSISSIAAAAPPPSKAFPDHHLRTIEAIADRLIPADENGPGALESGVPTYINNSFTSALATEKPAFLAGLAAVDAFARTSHGAPFADLDPIKKDSVLTALENNEAPGFTPDSRTYFNRIRQLTLEGMFGDPFYGGNKNFAGWDLIRYPGPRMAVSAEDQKLGKAIKPLRTSALGANHGH